MEALVGRGGMGSVYRCLTPEGQPCAIKILSNRLQQHDGERRFRNEMEILSALRHPNIVRLIDHGIDNDQPFIVMEFADGEPLNAVLSRVRKCDQYMAIRLIRSVAETLAYVHKQGIIVNDIKPSNMILTRRGSIKLVDFGIAVLARESEEAPMEPHQVIGTLRYLSPERINGRSPTPQSDIFSLGIVLYELITGQNPYDGEATADIVKNIAQSQHIPASRLAPITPVLNDVVFRSLAKDPEARFSSMSQFAAVLKRLEKSVDLIALLQQSEHAGHEGATARMDYTAELDILTDHAQSAIVTVPKGADLEISGDLASGSADQRVKAILKTTAALGEGAIPNLLDLVHDQDMKVRLTAFWEIARLNRSEVVDILFDFVLDVCFFTNEEHAKVSLRKRRLILGRLPGSDLFLRRPEISRCHLIFFIEEGSVSVELVGRGGAINGAAVSRADVKDGDVLTISTIQIRIHIHKPTPSEMIASRDVL